MDAPTPDRFSNPPDLSPWIPGATPGDVESHAIIRELAEFVMAENRRLSPYDADRQAAAELVRWYIEAPEFLDVIRRIGVLRFVTSYMRPKVWATLRYFKDHGIADLPL